MSDIVELDIERAVAGGRMLARHDGRVVFVSGTIPGERVRARITKAGRQLLWADTVDVITASDNRRDTLGDPACGGLAFAHIRYDRQRALKGQILADAFRRLARLELAVPDVAGSPEAGYRLRSRLHVHQGRAGFFLEGTHTLCDAAATGQLMLESLAAAGAVAATLESERVRCEALVVSENVAGTERTVHIEPAEGSLSPAFPALAALVDAHQVPLTGITTIVRDELHAIAGSESITDDAEAVMADATLCPGARWTRRPTSFFQGNRFLTGHLIRRVLELSAGTRAADLYAGVGLFSVAFASRGVDVLAIEGSRSSSEDLRTNAAPWDGRVRVQRSSIEEFLRRPPQPAPETVVVDPPRTGMSADALDHLAAWGMPRIVYVSCDPATLARDSARLTQHGFRLLSLEGIDLFPNTPHVEAIAAFERP